MDEILEFVFSLIWKFGMLLVIVWTGLYFVDNTDLNEITKAYAEISATQGGFTTSLMNELKDDLRGIGLDPNKTVINLKAIAPDGKDITSSVTSVTPQNQSPYPSNPKYAPRGTKISLEIYSTQKAYLTSALKFIGIDSSDMKKSYCKKVFMSERVE